jgi:DNA-3-methyladenine glycosylase II
MALADLSAADPALARVIASVGPMQLPADLPTFERFTRAIIGQQLSVRVASTISARFVALFGGESGTTAERALAAPEEDLRAAGLSGAKVAAVRALATFWIAEALTPDRLAQLSDEDLIALLTRVKGIGPWTVKMILIFSLHRPDVLPFEDLGLRMGIRKLDGLAELPTPKETQRRAERWRPWRTVATWYCWQSLKD